MAQTIKPFSRQGNYTIIDNYVLDTMIPSLKPAEIRLLIFIIRQTSGWHRDIATLSYDAIIAGTKLSSRSSVFDAIKGLKSKNLIIVKAGNRIESSVYGLNINYEAIIEQDSSPESVLPSSPKSVLKRSPVTVLDSSPESVLSKRKRRIKKEDKEPQFANNAIAGAAVLSSEPEKPAERKMTDFPEKFKLTQAMCDWLEENATHLEMADVTEEIDNMRDWALSKGQKRIDWVRFFYLWIRKANKTAKAQGKGSQRSNEFEEYKPATTVKSLFGKGEDQYLG